VVESRQIQQLRIVIVIEFCIVLYCTQTEGRGIPVPHLTVAAGILTTELQTDTCRLILKSLWKETKVCQMEYFIQWRGDEFDHIP